MRFDVAIVGGGPGGSTCGSLLKLYMPSLKVLIVEREVFPRDHVGESQLPVIPTILQEMGVWEQVEAAGFPVKIGATYRWGNTDELWDFDFLLKEQYRDTVRPGKYEGQRQRTAFQVDRSIYDKLLLDYAAKLGCTVRQGVKVNEIEKEGDRVTGLALSNGQHIEAKYYVDASGVSSIIRKAFDVPIDCPTMLRNIAVWDYWNNADWAINTDGGTRILIMSLGYGWLWFIPITETRTSVGLVVPAEHYKSTGLKPKEIYDQAIRDEPLIASLLERATREDQLATTNDWSYVADRVVGENWFLVGDACGFADPILSAGMSLAHVSGRQVAYTIMEMERKKLDRSWLIEEYDKRQRERIRQHIRFADYWYTANGRFTDLKELTRNIAASAGIEANADGAFQWLGSGGFANDEAAIPMLGGYELYAVKQIAQRFSGTPATWNITQYNRFKLDVEGAERTTVSVMHRGKILAVPAYRRNGKSLADVGAFGAVIGVLRKTDILKDVVEGLREFMTRLPDARSVDDKVLLAMCALETMIIDGWVHPSVDSEYGMLSFGTSDESWSIHRNDDIRIPAKVG